MLKPAFIDLSHHNVRSYEPAKAMGILGVIHKLSEGTTFIDGEVANRYPLAGEVGLLWGLYHFIRPGRISDQALHFVKAAQACADDETLYALDYEDAGVSLDDALLFMQEVQRLTGHEPVIYSGHVLKDKLVGDAVGSPTHQALMRFRLWLAQYTSSHAPTLPPGWSKYWAWQYSDAGQVQHIEPPTDLNAYDGTIEELFNDWSGV